MENEIHECAYCHQEAHYQLKNGKWCCHKSNNSCPALRKKFANKPETIKNKNYKQIYQNLSPETKRRQLVGFNTPEAHRKAGATFSRKIKEGLIKPTWAGKKLPKEVRRKIRLATIERIDRKSIGKFTPNFSFKACEYIDKLNERMGWHLQHAMNGGEFSIDGFFVDGYDKEKNIVFEYDEPVHYIDMENNVLRERDVERMTDIHEKLGCRFFRYNESKDCFYEWNFGLLAACTNVRG